MCVSRDEDVHYFTDALRFLNDLQWMYNSPVTKILVNDTLDVIPKDWLQILTDLSNDDLNNFVVNRSFKRNWPDSLKEFLNGCESLNKLSNKNPTQLPMLPTLFLKGLSLKKQHEILHLAKLVHMQCEEHNIHTVVDLGAGLGYVCQLLHYLYDYKVLGLEGSAQNVETVKKRQKKLYPESVDSVKYIHCKLNCNSGPTIQSLLEETFPGHRDVCLIGLHACGDLSVNMFDIYSNLKVAKLLILLSCCYHKLTTVESNFEDKEYFINFPISDAFARAVHTSKLDIGLFLRRPFLRLACQESADRWQEMSVQAHNEHSFHVLGRAVLELFAEQNDCSLQKLVQKGTRKSQCLDFQTYLNDSLTRYKFIKFATEDNNFNDELPDEDEIKDKLTILWEENKHKMKTVEIYTAFQMLIQSVAESVVLVDRLCWLKENGYEAKIAPVTNRKLSPRCHAVISWKM